MDKMDRAVTLLMVVEKASGHPQLSPLVRDAIEELNGLVKLKDEPKAMPVTKFPSLAKDDSDGE